MIPCVEAARTRVGLAPTDPETLNRHHPDVTKPSRTGHRLEHWVCHTDIREPRMTGLHTCLSHCAGRSPRRRGSSNNSWQRRQCGERTPGHYGAARQTSPRPPLPKGGTSPMWCRPIPAGTVDLHRGEPPGTDDYSRTVGLRRLRRHCRLLRRESARENSGTLDRSDTEQGCAHIGTETGTS